VVKGVVVAMVMVVVVKEVVLAAVIVVVVKEVVTDVLLSQKQRSTTVLK
jgi:hypothetical protein